MSRGRTCLALGVGSLAVVLTCALLGSIVRSRYHEFDHYLAGRSSLESSLMRKRSVEYDLNEALNETIDERLESLATIDDERSNGAVCRATFVGLYRLDIELGKALDEARSPHVPLTSAAIAVRDERERLGTELRGGRPRLAELCGERVPSKALLGSARTTAILSRALRAWEELFTIDSVKLVHVGEQVHDLKGEGRFASLFARCGLDGFCTGPK